MDDWLYLEVASGHVLLGEDDGRVTGTNRRSAYGGMATFLHSKLTERFCPVPYLALMLQAKLAPSLAAAVYDFLAKFL